jgi:FtsZ-binding cell division protein ZapB
MLGVVAIEGIKLLKQEIEDLKKQVEELKNGMCNSGNDIQ